MGNGSFGAYDSVDTAKLEQALAKSIQGVEVFGGKYEVDLRSMEQRNRHTGFSRHVRRTVHVSQSLQTEVSLSSTRQQSLRGIYPM